MSERKVTWDELAKGVVVAVGDRHTFLVERTIAHVVTLDAAVFQATSPVMRPVPLAPSRIEGGVVTGLSLLAQAFKHAADHSDQKLTVLAHCRELGRVAAEIRLSQTRAEHVLAYLKGDRAAWVGSCAGHASSDLEAIRSWAKRAYDVALPTRSFFADEDWSRVYDLYDQHVAELLGVESLSEARSTLTFGDPEHLACGAFWPRNGGYRQGSMVEDVFRIDEGVTNTPDTRVDLLFAEPGVAIPAQPPRQAPGARVYSDSRFVARKPLEPEPEPVAVCVQMTGMYFDTNKCFLLPSAMDGMHRLVALYEKHPRGELLVVGHTDTSGEPDANQALSLERAKSVVAFLADKPDVWLTFYETSTPETKRWGTHEDRLMFEHVTKKPFTVANIKAYQQAKDLADDGKVGPKTRKPLVADYMNSDGTSLPSEVTPVAHGCGENFPLVDSGDNTHEANNRRVELFLFEPEIVPAPSADISKAGTKDYAKWRARVVETIALSAEDTARRVLPTTFALEALRQAASQLSEAGFVHFIHSALDNDVPADAIVALLADLPAMQHPATFVVTELPEDYPAAYDSDTRQILIHERVLAPMERGEAQGWVLAALLIEEFGHHIDHVLRADYSKAGGDASGDEGRRMALALLCVHWDDDSTIELAGWNGQDYALDWAQMKQRLSPSSLSESDDTQLGSLEFHGGPEARERPHVEIGDWQLTLSSYEPTASYPSFAAFAHDSAESRRFESYFAFAHKMSIYGLVEMARKLDKRLRGQPSGLFKPPESGPLDPRARLTVLQTLKTIYNLLEGRFRDAPIGPDGLPAFSARQLGHRQSPDTEIFVPGSPLAGIVEDIAPFGSIDGWVAELNTTRLPPIPPRPRDSASDDDIDWGDPVPVPQPPVLDPERDAEDSPIDLGRAGQDAGRVIDETRAPSHDAANRNTTIVDAIWTLAGEVSSAAEALGPAGAVIINFVGLYNTLSEVDDLAKQEGALLALRLGAAAIDLAANDRALVRGPADISRALLENYIRRDDQLASRWATRSSTPAARLREQYALTALDGLSQGLRRVVANTEAAAPLVPGFVEADERTRAQYIAMLRARAYREYAAAVRAAIENAVRR